MLHLYYGEGGAYIGTAMGLRRQGPRPHGDARLSHVNIYGPNTAHRTAYSVCGMSFNAELLDSILLRAKHKSLLSNLK